MENLNKQKTVEREVKELIQKYNTLYKSQLYEFFAKDGRERFVGKALKVLEKERDIFIHQEMKMVAANEESFGAREFGTLQCVWVLLGVMDQKKVEEHFLASKVKYLNRKNPFLRHIYTTEIKLDIQQINISS